MSFIDRLGRACVASLLMCSTAALADSVTIPHTFSANTPAVAAQVNANFGAVATAVNDNAADIAALQQALTALQGIVNAQHDEIVLLQSQMAAVQGSSVMALAANLDMIDVQDPNDPNVYYPTAQFHGINVRIVNGLGITDTINGLGNLTVGYNELDLVNAVPFCSNGAFNASQVICEGNGDIWAANQRSGSHTLIVGTGNAYSRYGGFLAGATNILNGDKASVSGGSNNIASGSYSSVSGGIYNTASGHFSSVSGGNDRTAPSDFSWAAGALFQSQ